MPMLAFVFQTLAVRRPDLDAGVHAYAKAGFGEYLGFFSAFGHRAGACVGNVAHWILIMPTTGAVAPAPGDGDTALAIALSSAGLWGFFLLVRRGVKEAAAINRIVTVAELAPIVVLVVRCSSSSSRPSPSTTSAAPTTPARRSTMSTAP